MKHPIQPLVKDKSGVLRFQENAIVRHLLDWAKTHHGYGMNQWATMPFSDEDWQQFAQLIGYSLSGYGDLSYVSDDAYNIAAEMAEGLTETEARISYLEDKLQALRSALREPMAGLFGVHPDDLKG